MQILSSAASRVAPAAAQPQALSPRQAMKPMTTSGVDLVTLNEAPAQNLSLAERRLGWAQLGATAGVRTLNSLATVGLTVGLAALGNAWLGPAGAVGGALVGLVGGVNLTAFGQSNAIEGPTRQLKNGAAIIGAHLGAFASKPLQKLFPDAIKEYQLSDAATPNRVSDQEAKDFEAKLKPGDVVLTLSDDDPMFHWLISLKKKPLDHSHAALYAGDGKVLEANTDTGRVGYRDAAKAFANKAHLVAVRPHYKEGEAEKVIAQGATYIGRRYDWFAGMSDKRLGCVEVPYHSLLNAAPAHQVPISKIFPGKEYIFPSDYLRLSNSEVVASAGVARPASKMAMARYNWAAEQAV